MSFVAYILRINLSVAGEAMSTDLGLSRVQLGIVLGAFAWGYALFQFPGGLVGDRFGARKALGILVAGWGVFNLLPALVPGSGALSPMVLVALLALVRFLMGAAQAPLFPIIGGATIRLWFPRAAWGFPNAVTNAGAAFGSAAAGPLIGWLVVSSGWRQSFLLTAPLGFGLAALWWWYYRDCPGEHPAVSPGEAEYVADGRDAEELTPPEPGSWRRLLRNRDVLLITLSYFCTNYLFYFFFNWLVIYLVDERKFSLLQSGWYAAAPWMTGAAGALFGGALSDRLTRRFGPTAGCRWPAVVALLLGALLLVGVARAADPITAVVLLSLCLACQQATDPIYWAAMVPLAGRDSASACGVLNTAGNAMGGIGAVLVPVMVERFGWGVALGTTAGFALLAAMLWLLVRIPGGPLDAPPERA